MKAWNSPPIHGYAKKSVATKENVNFGKPEKTRIPRIKDNVENHQGAGYDMPEKWNHHHRFSPKIFTNVARLGFHSRILFEPESGPI